MAQINTISVGGSDYDIASATILTGTLTTAGWSSNAQTIVVSGMPTTGYAYTVSPQSAFIEAYISAQIYADDVTTANQITFHCSTVPTSAITVVIKKEAVY